MSRLVVADSGPLIGLAKTGHLNLLRSLFGTVMIPPAVLDELSITSDREGAACLREAVDAAGWIRTVAIRDPEAVSGLSLGLGESEAIALALEQKAILLIDERRGRIAARRKGVKVVGTGRVLLAAKEKGFLQSVGAALDGLADSGYRLSSDLRNRLLELDGETEG